MERRAAKDLDGLIELLESAFEEVQIIQTRATEALLLLRAQCRYRNFQIKVTEIVDSSGRNYSFYVLADNRVVVGFDNSEDRRAQALKYGKRNWKAHHKERVPHQHTYLRASLLLTAEMSIADFVKWLQDNFDSYLVQQKFCP